MSIVNSMNGVRGLVPFSEAGVIRENDHMAVQTYLDAIKRSHLTGPSGWKLLTGWQQREKDKILAGKVSLEWWRALTYLKMGGQPLPLSTHGDSASHEGAHHEITLITSLWHFLGLEALPIEDVNDSLRVESRRAAIQQAVEALHEQRKRFEDLIKEYQAVMEVKDERLDDWDDTGTAVEEVLEELEAIESTVSEVEYELKEKIAQVPPYLNVIFRLFREFFYQFRFIIDDSNLIPASYLSS